MHPCRERIHLAFDAADAAALPGAKHSLCAGTQRVRSVAYFDEMLTKLNEIITDRQKQTLEQILANEVELPDAAC